MLWFYSNYLFSNTDTQHGFELPNFCFHFHEGPGRTFRPFTDIEAQKRMAHLKDAMKAMIDAAGSDGGVIGEEHVAIFKRKIQEDLEQRKRRRLELGISE